MVKVKAKHTFFRQFCLGVRKEITTHFDWNEDDKVVDLRSARLPMSELEGYVQGMTLGFVKEMYEQRGEEGIYILSEALEVNEFQVAATSKEYNCSPQVAKVIRGINQLVHTLAAVEKERIQQGKSYEISNRAAL